MEDYRKKELNLLEEIINGFIQLVEKTIEFLLDIFLKLLTFLFLFLSQIIKKYIFKIEENNFESQITLEDLKRKTPKFKKIESLLERKTSAPIGISYLNKKPLFLEEKTRCEHTIVSGATGTGKTTLLKTLLTFSIKQGHPVIVIDPKGEKKDILEIKEKLKNFGREKDFMLFSLSDVEDSFSYNPLENGQPEQIKARLLDGLEFEHSYFKAQSSLWLGSILSALKFLNKEPSFRLLRELLSNEEEIRSLKRDVLKIDKKRRREIGLFLNSASQIKREDLAGLLAQIASLDTPLFKDILSPKKESLRKKLSLSSVLQDKKIAYFQMNVNGFGEISRQIGRMILQDLKVLSNQIQSGEKIFSYDFCPIFIDEFGSFATRDFADFLKMARSSKIALHLFFQGLSDLNSVNVDFKNQILGNTIYKILFRQDISKDVETLSEMAGTLKSKKKTYQIEGTEQEEELTGLGSLRDTREMKIEFDVFKKLSQGEAILIDKKRHREDLFRVLRV